MSTEKWRKESAKQYAFRISYSTGIPSAVKKAADESGTNETAFVRQALVEKLIRDGYLQPSDKTEE